MRSVVLVAALGCSCIFASSAAYSGELQQVNNLQDDTAEPGGIQEIQTVQQVVQPEYHYDVGDVNCSLCCEARRWHSDVPKGHCKAIVQSVRQAVWNAVDTVLAFHEWGQKINNTLRACSGNQRVASLVNEAL